MLVRGARVFHVNSEEDVAKLEGWLKKGPKYTQVKSDSRSPRKIYLSNPDMPKAEILIGVVVVMSETFTTASVMPILETWRASR